MLVRTAQPQDAEGLYALCCEQAARTLPRDIFEKVYAGICKDGQRRLVVAVEEDELLGYADLQLKLHLSRCELVAVFQELYVKESVRGHGVGNGLMLALSAQMKALGCFSMEASCQRVNVKAQEFLEHNGFVRSRHGFTREEERR